MDYLIDQPGNLETQTVNQIDRLSLFFLAAQWEFFYTKFLINRKTLQLAMAHADRFDRLRSRRIPPEKITAAKFESFLRETEYQYFNYLVGAMSPIDAEFTENTFAEGERVRDQLQKNFSANFKTEFEFQGSVTSDTHIRIHSDIDLLSLHGGFYSVDEGVQPLYPYPYQQSLDDLVSMRAEAVCILKKEFPKVTVDASPGKSIVLEGGSLRRKVDVVIGNWWNTELWERCKVKTTRGVRILDSKVLATIRNKPFWHNYEINKKDEETGTLRKVIRLLKTLKYDADPELKISSYDIAAIAWNMSNAVLTVQEDAYLPLAKNALAELKRFIENDVARNMLSVPNGMRKVFGSDGATLDSLKALHQELDELITYIEIKGPISLSDSVSLLTESKLPSWQERRPQVVQKYSF